MSGQRKVFPQRSDLPGEFFILSKADRQALIAVYPSQIGAIECSVAKVRDNALNTVVILPYLDNVARWVVETCLM